jgi:hypothetical protein
LAGPVFRKGTDYVNHRYIAVALGSVALANVLTSNAGNAAVAISRPIKLAVPETKPARMQVAVEKPAVKAALPKPQLLAANSAHPIGGTSFNPSTHPERPVGGSMAEKARWEQIVEKGDTTNTHKF